MDFKEFCKMFFLGILPPLAVILAYTFLITLIVTANAVVGTIIGIVVGFFMLFGVVKYIWWISDKIF